MRTRNPASHPGQRASVTAWLAALLGAAVFAVLTAAVGVWSMLHVSGEVAAMRDSVLESTAVDGDTEIELSVGPLIFGMLRTGLNFVELEPEVRSALGAVRGTSVGVYRVDRSGWDQSEMMAKVDAAMSRRGWERLVAVLENQQCVLAYLPARIPSPRDLRLSVLVLDGEQLVVTYARVNPEPVFELALREAARHTPHH
jgi:hypothetical protein